VFSAQDQTILAGDSVTYAASHVIVVVTSSSLPRD